MPFLAALGPIVGSALIGGGASVAGGLIGASANRNASKNQLAASQSADALQKQANDQAFQLGQEQQNYERWLQSATSAARQPYLDALTQAIGAGGGSGYSPSNLKAPDPYVAPTYTAAQPFTAPTQAEAENDPAYQLAKQDVQTSVEHGASSHGTLLTGATSKDLARFTNDLASQQYDKIYQRAQGTYQLNEADRQAAFDRNAQGGYNAYALNSQNAFNYANLNNQSAYNAASLGLQGYGQRLSALGTLAGLAAPGAYPGDASAPTRPPTGIGANQPGYATIQQGQDYALPITADKTPAMDMTPNASGTYVPQTLARRGAYA
jgi:hypothetical protein